MQVRVVLTLLAGCAMLAGCEPKPSVPEPVAIGPDLYGRMPAKECTTAPVTPPAGGEASTTMTVSNDGGFCAITLTTGGKPYAVGLVTTSPAHGRPLFTNPNYGEPRSLVEYIPDPGYAGADAFTIKLRSGNSDSTLHVAVTVTGANGPAATPAAAATPRPASAAPTHH